jgi:outer membrane biogenesis lipoprotein LolB
MMNLLINRNKARYGRVLKGARQGIATLFFALCIASGCVSTPPMQTLSYAVSGKVRIVAPTCDQVLRFRWRQADGYFDVWLWGALGVGRTHLQGTQEVLTITAPQQPVITGPAGQLMHDRLGWVLPLDALGAWLAGSLALSLPMSSSTTGPDGRLQRMVQADWTITFADHRQVDGQWRPERIVIQGRGITLDVSIRHPRAVMS